MQKANVTLRVAGDLRNTVPKYNVTVAEVEVLRAIHGADAVVDLELRSEVKVPYRQEKERLLQKYKAARHPETGRPMVEEVFPGMNPQLPIKFKDIGFNVGGGRGRKAAASEPDEPEEENANEGGKDD